MYKTTVYMPVTHQKQQISEKGDYDIAKVSMY